MSTFFKCTLFCLLLFSSLAANADTGRTGQELFPTAEVAL